jgi:hypothetical protein
MNTSEISERVDRSVAAWGPTTIRITLALLWLSNVSWKVPSAFGESADACRGLCGYVQDGISHPVFPGSAGLFETVIQPNLTAFGWTTLLAEASVAALLLAGRFLRTAAVVSLLQSLGILASVANAPEEWYWSYLLMAALSLAVLVLAPTLRPTPPRAMAVVVALYGVVVAIAHAGAGLTGDGNSAWTLFSGSTDLPDDFGRNVFPGSIALGLLFVAVGVALWLLADADDATRRVIGWILVALSVALLLTYGPDGLIVRLGSRATSVAVLAAIGLTLVPSSRDTSEADRARSATRTPMS